MEFLPMNPETSTLVLLVRSFPATEHREIRKFLSSPFFSTRKDMLPLFDRIREKPVMDKATLWSELFPTDPFDDQQLRLLMSYLHKLLETYVAVREWQNDPVGREVDLAVGYRKRGLDEQYSRARRVAERSLQKHPLRDGDYHAMRYRLMWEEYGFQTVQNPADAASFREMVHHIDASYLSNRLKLTCMAIAQRQVYHTSLETLEISEIISLAERPEWQDTPAVNLYLACYKMLRHPEEDSYFRAFSGLLADVQPVFSVEEIRGLYLQAINYCIRRLNNGEHRFFRDVLELYQAGLEREYLLEQGVLSRFTYHNIVAAALHVGELDWVNTFIHNYKALLERRYRESSFSFNLARLEYHRKRYQAVLELLQKANYRDPLLNLAARTLLLKTWYELGETELLHAHLDAMRNYIQRKKVIGYHKANYLNIVRYTDRLLRARYGDARAVSNLEQSIRSEEVLTERDWLLAQLGEL